MPNNLIRYKTGGGIVIDADLVLLLDRPGRREVRLPKGHIDPGETPAETALRETAEETGYSDLEILEDLGAAEVTFRYKERQYLRTEHYFLMRLRSREQVPRPPSDQAQFQPIWRSFEEALGMLTFKAERLVLSKAIQAWKPYASSDTVLPD